MNTVRRIGVVAGSGDLPLSCVERIRQMGAEPYVVMLNGEVTSADSLKKYCAASITVPLGSIRKPLSFFHAHHVQQIVIVGGVRRQGLLLRLRPDMLAVKLLASLTDKRDDALLRALSAIVEEQGITILSVHDLLPELAIAEGSFTPRTFSPQEVADAEIGWGVLEALGACDVGQSVVAFEGTVIAVEGIEGTDALIARAGELCQRRGGVLVKKIKSQQDGRLDTPTVGVATIDRMKEAGLTALMVGARSTVVVNPQAVLTAAVNAQIAIMGKA